MQAQVRAYGEGGGVNDSDEFDWFAPKPVHVFGGIDLRDYFAAKAMQGIFASDTHCDDCGNFSDCSNEYYSHAARHAYAMAAAMLKAREVKP